ncbi:MAG: leucine-rich repeat protein [Candidatus Methanoplasma sp.]|jgi:uncharacterized repeat protein (TIGR02543 family)|nr:leucine-rich repeat protein [Candidatus Methanoplasma sp.]
MSTDGLRKGVERHVPAHAGQKDRRLYLAVLAIVCVMAASVTAASLASSDDSRALTPHFDPNTGVYYELDEVAHTAVIVDLAGGRDIVEITGPITYNGDAFTVVEVRDHAMASKNNLTKVVLPDSVKAIGASAFNGCANLKTVEMKGVETIGASAFKACPSLLATANSFRDVTSVGEDAFSGALASGSELSLQSCKDIKANAFKDSKIKTIDIRSATTIGDYAFINCAELDQATCDNVQTLGTEAFRDTKSLRNIVFPQVTTVGEAAFMNSDLSAGAIFGDSLVTVKARAFQNAKITSVDLKLATSISMEAFVSCTNLQSFAVSPLNTAYDTYTTGDVLGPGALYDKTSPTHKMILFPNALTGNFKLHSSTTEVADKVFANTKIEFVDLSNLPTVSDYMFYSNTSLKSVVMHNVTSVGESAFEFCTALETVEFGDKPVSIGEKAFYGGAGSNYIKRLSIPAGSTVGSRAFEGNTSLASLTVWDDITFVADSFQGCSSLASLTVRRDVLTFVSNVLPAFAWSFGGNSITTLTLDVNVPYSLGANLAPAPGKQLRLTSSTDNTSIAGVYAFNDNGTQLDPSGRAGGLYEYESPTLWKLISRTFTVTFWGMAEADVNSDYQDADQSKYTELVAKMEVELDMTLDYMPSQSLEKYIVGGWYSAPNGGGTQLLLSAKIQSSMSVYAKYVPKMYTIFINADPAAGGTLESSGVSGSASTGVSGSANSTYQYSENVTLNATPSLGYGFVGITEGDNALSRDYDNLNGYNMKFDVPSDKKYTAYFDRIWAVTFDPSGGVFDGGSLSKTLTYVNNEKLDNSGAPMGRPAGFYPGDPVKPGLHFQGWYTANGVKVETTENITGDATLTARWYANVTFDANGGSVGGNAVLTVPVYDIGLSATLFGSIAQVATAPAGTGYIFDAWYYYVGSAYGSACPGTVTVSSDMTVKAKWSARLTLDPDGGTFGSPLDPGYVDDGLKIHYDIAIDDGESYPQLQSISRTDSSGSAMAYKWFVKDASGNVGAEFDPSTTVLDRSMELVAVWYVTITFTTGGGSYIGSDWAKESVVTVQYGTEFGLVAKPAIEMSGAAPTGWFDMTKNPHVLYSSATPVNDSTTVTPVFDALFVFHTMGGAVSDFAVTYTAGTDTFQDILNKAYASLGSVSDIVKNNLHHEGTGLGGIVWYKESGHSRAWSPGEIIVSDADAYIRWQAVLQFDAANPSPNPSGTLTVDEGTPYSALSSMPGFPAADPAYPAGVKTFEGWYDSTLADLVVGPRPGMTPGSGTVAGDMTITAKYGVYVTFVFNGGTDGVNYPGETQAVLRVDGSGLIQGIIPNLARVGIDGLVWYYDGATPLHNKPVSGVPGVFVGNTISPVENTTIQARWYVKVDIILPNGATNPGVPSAAMYILEGSTLQQAFNENGVTDLDPKVNVPGSNTWTFVGWFENTQSGDRGTAYYLNSGGPVSNMAHDVTMTPEWDTTVDFILDYTGAPTVPQATVRVGHPLPTTVPGSSYEVRSGITFGGWLDRGVNPWVRYDQAGYSTPGGAPAVEKALTLYASWFVKVAFDENGGSGLNVVTGSNAVFMDPDGVPGSGDEYYNLTEGIRLGDIVFQNPAKPGMVFVAWFDGADRYDPATQFTHDVTLLANYGYLVHFDANGGTPTVIPDMNVVDGASLVLPESPAKAGLTFEGWHIGAVGGSLYVAQPITAETTLVAKWQATVTFYDGVSRTAVGTRVYDEGAPFTYGTAMDGNDVIRVTVTIGAGAGTQADISKFVDKWNGTGWDTYYSVFGGWYDTGAQAAFGTTVTTSASLVPTWMEKVTFYDAAGTPLGTKYLDTGAYLADAVASFPLSSNGWADKSSPLVKLNPATYRIQNSGEFIALDYAKVTFDTDGGSPAVIAPVLDVPYGTMFGAIAPPDPTRGGKHFAGWYDGNVRYGFTTPITGDVTLKAKWDDAPIDRHAILAYADGNTKISPVGAVRVIGGEDARFRFSAAEGYVPSVYIDGVLRTGLDGSYVFEDVRSDHTIVVIGTPEGSKPSDHLLTVDISGEGEVFYSHDGETYSKYVNPLPLFENIKVYLKAVPGEGCTFEGWSGHVDSGERIIVVESDGRSSLSVNARFGGPSEAAGTGDGEMAVINLALVILAVAAGATAIFATRKREDDENAPLSSVILRLASLAAAVVAVVALILTQGIDAAVFSDKWTALFFVLFFVAAVTSFLGVRTAGARD